MSSKLELIIGPMFSGKSTELIRRARLFTIINKKVLVIKPNIDNRYSENKIVSHSFESVQCITLNNLNELNNIQSYQVIIIDEGQFFNDLKNTIIEWLDKYNLYIIIGGLDGDFEKNPIGQILSLIPHADICQKINSLCTICNDGTPAAFTYRKNQSKDIILIGGNDSYIPVCKKHNNNIS